jgi:hypothetical protein
MNCGWHKLCREVRPVNNTRRRIAEAAQVLLMVVGVTACTAEKDRLDAEVRRLCALDGGVNVYETVALPPERFDQFNSVHVPDTRYAKPTDDYYYERSTEYLVRGNPDLLRFHTKLIRRSDKKVLGEGTSYARRGGDLPGPWHPSSFRCPQDVNVASKVFKRAQTKSAK